MTAVLIVIHLILAIAMIFIILIQQSEGGLGGLGGGGGGGGMGGFMTGRATANLLTRVTAVLAALFMATSLTLAILADSGRERGSILDRGTPPPANQQQAPSAPGLPQVPSLPKAPAPSK
ncbi:MAG: preprotein translocase subunit SecG [Rhodospirillales bacterium]|jgi:preprotein translocase subunit SecG|nr:preprotein translocase subunit SecG [Rhodospirillales bacterium]MDP6645660.1 preprotein translocase subunit SecG [Rhodospirillales bacterium]MDP6842284.1 preprotein translocase subunit SecG [Rhodospirillales bacterium]|tara:strand:+ start:192 stop:551 length:360 start_codon:yes stop_codon:yes gene_type:complete